MKQSDNALRHAIIEHLPRLRRFAFALTGSHSDADDLLQNTVERILLKGAPQGDGFVRWMFRVCKNLWIDDIRSSSKRIVPGDDEVYKQMDSLDGEQQRMDSLQLDEVNRAMWQLDQSQRMVLALISLEGYSYQEAASILEIPIGTVMSRLARARQKMMRLLNDDKQSAN